MSQNAWLTCIQRRSESISPIPIGAFANAARKRSSDSCSLTVFSYRSTNTATFERSTSGSKGLNM